MTTIDKVKQLVAFGKKSRTGTIILLEIALGIALALGSLMIFADIADEVIEKETAAFDLAVSDSIYSLRGPTMTKLMFGVSFLGSKEFLFLATIVLIIVLWRRHRREAILFTATLLLSAGLNNLIKFAIHRGRPEMAPIETASFYSFPSGHSMNSLVFYALLAYFAYHFTKNKTASIVIAAVSFVLVASIGFSRIYLGAHYPTDVLAGFVAGFCVFVTALSINRTIKLNRLFEESRNNKTGL